MKDIFYEYIQDKNLNMKVTMGHSSRVRCHFHKMVEILYVLSGEVETQVADEAFVAEKDEIIFVHNYYTHSFAPKTEYKKYVLIVTSNYENDIDKILKTSTLPSLLRDREYNRKEILPIFEKLYDADNVKMPPLVKKGYVDILLGQLFNHYRTLPIKTSSNIDFMVDILHYIDAHYKEPLSLDSVAAAFGYNKYYFSRMFNKYIGESLTNYINVVRLRNFMYKAGETESPQISKLAEECGFESMPTFYRAFSKLYNVSPKTYFSKKQSGNQDSVNA